MASRIQNGEKPFDLILMDIHMPVMDGLEAASSITSLDVKTPIVAVTANIMPDDLELYKINGMSDCIGKPFTSHELWRTLLRYFHDGGRSEDLDEQLPSDDEKSQKLLLASFVRDRETSIADIRNALDSGDVELAHRVAHTIKGMAGQIGKKQLQEAAGVVEAMLSDKQGVVDEEKVGKLEHELNLVLSELAQLLDEPHDLEIAETADPEKVQEIIAELEPLLVNNNAECINLLDDIRTIPGTADLVREVEEFEFERAFIELLNVKNRFRDSESGDEIH